MSDAITKPEPAKHWVQTFVDRAHGTIQQATPAPAVPYLKAGGSTLVDYGIGGVVGGLLGAGHANFGLDTKGGPVDGWLAGISAIAAIGLAGHWPEAAEYARRAGANAATILAFRKSYEVVKHAPLAGGHGGGGAVQRLPAPKAGTGPGVASEDPIERVAKGLG